MNSGAKFVARHGKAGNFTAKQQARGLPIVRHRSYIQPGEGQGDTIDTLPIAHQLRQQLSSNVKLHTRRDVLEDLRFKYVNAGVDGRGNRLVAGGLFLEAK